MWILSLCPSEISKRGYCLLYQGNWEEFIRESVVAWQGKSLNVLINKLVLVAVVSHLWNERNRRLFQKKNKSVG